MKSIFITGTDTGIGKTVVTGLLARYLKEKNVNVITQKWIQTGSNVPAKDIIFHLRFISKKPSDIKKYLPHVSPYVFKLPASPHLASLREKNPIDIGKIKKSFEVLAKQFDWVIVEGIGGSLVPLNRKKLVIDIVKELKLPTIVIVGNRLGAINHTLLTIEALRSRGIKIIGLIFNDLSEATNRIVLEDNPKIVEYISKETILGILPYSKNKALLYKKFIPIAKKISNLLK